MTPQESLDWLLAGDPAIRWQTLRDLTDAGEEKVARERAQVAHEGWGARLLAHQEPSGRWGGELYRHKWRSTTYTLALLRRMGLARENEQARAGCRELLEGGWRGPGIISYARSSDRVDRGVMGLVLTILAYFRYPDERLHEVVGYLLEEQEEDGRWYPAPGIEQLRYALAGTLLILEGLWEYERAYPERAIRIVESRRAGRAFLLRHRLYQEPGGEPIHRSMTLFSFPPRWHYDVLAALDHFRACEAARDDRLENALALLNKKRRKDGTWPLQNRHRGETFFEMEEVGRPSRWNTLRALRVQRWWHERE